MKNVIHFHFQQTRNKLEELKTREHQLKSHINHLTQQMHGDINRHKMEKEKIVSIHAKDIEDLQAKINAIRNDIRDAQMDNVRRNDNVFQFMNHINNVDFDTQSNSKGQTIVFNKQPTLNTHNHDQMETEPIQLKQIDEVEIYKLTNHRAIEINGRESNVKEQMEKGSIEEKEMTLGGKYFGVDKNPNEAISERFKYKDTCQKDETISQTTHNLINEHNKSFTPTNKVVEINETDINETCKGTKQIQKIEELSDNISTVSKTSGNPEMHDTNTEDILKQKEIERNNPSIVHDNTNWENIESTLQKYQKNSENVPKDKLFGIPEPVCQTNNKDSTLVNSNEDCTSAKSSNVFDPSKTPIDESVKTYMQQSRQNNSICEQLQINHNTNKTSPNTTLSYEQVTEKMKQGVFLEGKPDSQYIHEESEKEDPHVFKKPNMNDYKYNVQMKPWEYATEGAQERYSSKNNDRNILLTQRINNQDVSSVQRNALGIQRSNTPVQDSHLGLQNCDTPSLQRNPNLQRCSTPNFQRIKTNEQRRSVWNNDDRSIKPTLQRSLTPNIQGKNYCNESSQERFTQTNTNPIFSNLQRCNTPKLQRNNASLERCNTPSLQRPNNTHLQITDISTIQRCNAPNLQRSNTTGLERCNTPNLQRTNNTPHLQRANTPRQQRTNKHLQSITPNSQRRYLQGLQHNSPSSFVPARKLFSYDNDINSSTQHYNQQNGREFHEKPSQIPPNRMQEIAFGPNRNQTNVRNTGGNAYQNDPSYYYNAGNTGTYQTYGTFEGVENKGQMNISNQYRNDNWEGIPYSSERGSEIFNRNNADEGHFKILTKLSFKLCNTIVPNELNRKNTKRIQMKTVNMDQHGMKNEFYTGNKGSEKMTTQKGNDQQYRTNQEAKKTNCAENIIQMKESNPNQHGKINEIYTGNNVNEQTTYQVIDQQYEPSKESAVVGKQQNNVKNNTDFVNGSTNNMLKKLEKGNRKGDSNQKKNNDGANQYKQSSSDIQGNITNGNKQNNGNIQENITKSDKQTSGDTQGSKGGMTQGNKQIRHTQEKMANKNQNGRDMEGKSNTDIQNNLQTKDEEADVKPDPAKNIHVAKNTRSDQDKSNNGLTQGTSSIEDKLNRFLSEQPQHSLSTILHKPKEILLKKKPPGTVKKRTKSVKFKAELTSICEALPTSETTKRKLEEKPKKRKSRKLFNLDDEG